jgi:hypothetical protein
MPVFKILTPVFPVQNSNIVEWYTPEWEECKESSAVVDADMWL